MTRARTFAAVASGVTLHALLACALLFSLGYIGFRISGAFAVIAAPEANVAPEPPADTRIPPAQPAIAQADDYQILQRRTLSLPIEGLKRRDLQDTFSQGRSGGKPHEATDILAALGTPVHAIEDGTIEKLFLSKPGGITIYEFDPDREYCYYYAHLDRYADGLREGQKVQRGDIIGYVGATGNARATTPHLHLAIFKLDGAKHWWQGTAVDPYPVLRHILEANKDEK